MRIGTPAWASSAARISNSTPSLHSIEVRFTREHWNVIRWKNSTRRQPKKKKNVRWQLAVSNRTLLNQEVPTWAWEAASKAQKNVRLSSCMRIYLSQWSRRTKRWVSGKNSRRRNSKIFKTHIKVKLVNETSFIREWSKPIHKNWASLRRGKVIVKRPRWLNLALFLKCALGVQVSWNEIAALRIYLKICPWLADWGQLDCRSNRNHRKEMRCPCHVLGEFNPTRIVTSQSSCTKSSQVSASILKWPKNLIRASYSRSLLSSAT